MAPQACLQHVSPKHTKHLHGLQSIPTCQPQTYKTSPWASKYAYMSAPNIQNISMGFKVCLHVSPKHTKHLHGLQSMPTTCQPQTYKTSPWASKYAYNMSAPNIKNISMGSKVCLQHVSPKHTKHLHGLQSMPTTCQPQTYKTSPWASKYAYNMSAPNIQNISMGFKVCLQHVSPKHTKLTEISGNRQTNIHSHKLFYRIDIK